MDRLLDAIHRAAKALCGAAFMAIFVLYVLQIVLRYLFGATWLWTPDLMRLLFVWAVFFGATALYHTSEHLTVDIFVQRLSPFARRTFGLAIDAASATFFLLLIVKGWEIADKRMRVPFDTWDLPTGYAYAAAPVCAFLMLLIAFDRIAKNLRRGSFGKDDRHDR